MNYVLVIAVVALSFVVGGYALGPRLAEDHLAHLRLENASMQVDITQLYSDLHHLEPRVKVLETNYTAFDDRLRLIEGGHTK